jgi:hypothetical protein
MKRDTRAAGFSTTTAAPDDDDDEQTPAAIEVNTGEAFWCVVTLALVAIMVWLVWILGPEGFTL